MTERQVTFWIRDNLSLHIKRALEVATVSYPKLIFNENDLAGIAQREVGFLLLKYVPEKLKFDIICSMMKGDYVMRKGETEKQYHGYSFWQLDVNTHPEFIKSGEWKNPFKACHKAILTLEDKRKYLETKEGVTDIHRASIAAYNCGQRNVARAIREGRDIDIYTFNHDYSKEVLRFSEIYKNLPSNN